MSECKFLIIDDHRECLIHYCKETVCLNSRITTLEKERDEVVEAEKRYRSVIHTAAKDLDAVTKELAEARAVIKAHAKLCDEDAMSELKSLAEKAEARVKELEAEISKLRLECYETGISEQGYKFELGKAESLLALAEKVVASADYLTRKARTPEEKGAGLMALVERLAAFEKAKENK